MASQKDIKDRISSVKNIRKITRAMEMVAAARLRRAEQRIEELRPYADALRRMTRRASEGAESLPSIPLLKERENVQTVGLLLVTGDRGLAGGFNSQIIRAGNRRARELEDEGKDVRWFASGKKGVSSLEFRGRQVTGFEGFTDRPAFSDAREIGDALTSAYVDGDVDRVEIIYTHYVSTMTQEVSHETLLPLQQADVMGDEDDEDDDGDDDDESRSDSDEGANVSHKRSLWIYEPS